MSLDSHTLIVPERKKIVLSTDLHQEIVQAIPHAKTFEHDGKTLVALNHGPEEALVLRNMGLRVKEPIKVYYDWPGRFITPMNHQVETAAFLTSYQRALCLNAPGTGKTLSALWAADYLIETGVAHRALIVVPLSTVYAVWGKALYEHFPHRCFEVIVGSRQQRLEKLQNPALQFAVINHDGFTIMHDYLKDFDIVIYDEATALKAPSSQRFRVFNNWINKKGPWVWLMTGTPFSQSPIDAWALARLVQSPYVPRSFTAFREMVMMRVSTFKWVPRPEALEICRKALQPSICYSLDECKDIPQTSFVERETELSAVQARAYKEMEERSIVTFRQTGVSAANAAVMLGKLLQICCGVVYGNEGERVVIDSEPRHNTLIELLEEIGDKVIVFCPLRGVQEWLYDRLKKNYDVAIVNGDTSKAERNRIFTEFQDTERIQVLLAHPKVAAHGLTLTRAKHVIWYAPIYSLEQYEQANARVRRLNTTEKTVVWNIYATKFEAELYRRLRLKKQVLTDFLKLVQGVNDDEL